MMRQFKQKNFYEEAEEGGNIFISMTDIIVSFLFIILLLTVFFVSRYASDKVVPKSDFDALKEELSKKDPLETYAKKTSQAQRELLTSLSSMVKDDISKANVQNLNLEVAGDALRFQGNGLFALGSADLTPDALKIIKLLGEHLNQILPCFSLGKNSHITNVCNPDLILFETIQVEGHTDSSGILSSNLELSTKRALAAFEQIVPSTNSRTLPSMLQYKNQLKQPILAVAGYGQMRPAVPNAPNGQTAENRRIDLRFIMYHPTSKAFIPYTVQDLVTLPSQLVRKKNEGSNGSEVFKK